MKKLEMTPHVTYRDVGSIRIPVLALAIYNFHKKFSLRVKGTTSVMTVPRTCFWEVGYVTVEYVINPPAGGFCFSTGSFSCLIDKPSAVSVRFPAVAMRDSSCCIAHSLA